MITASPLRVPALDSLRVPVLMYHELADRTVTPSPLAVDPEVFAAQLGYLRDAGFNTLTAGEAVAILKDGVGALPERPVVLTFDDGYGDFYQQAAPRLRQYGLTGTIFMTTGWIGLAGKAKLMMNWQELADVHRAGVEIGAHTCTHPQLDQLPERELREELGASKSLLEDRLGIRVPGLAYPYGYSSPRVREVARELGYDYAYAVDNTLTTSGAQRFTMPRLTIKRTTSLASFIQMVNGEDTPALRRDRMLTRGYSVVRRARAAVHGAATSSAG